MVPQPTASHLTITGDMRMPKNVAPRAASPHLQWDGPIVSVIEVEAKMMRRKRRRMMMMMNITISIMMMKHCISKGTRTLLNLLYVSTLLFSTLLYSTLLYSTLLYSTLLYSTLLYSTLLYSTLFNLHFYIVSNLV